jgi:hypothetical protein
VLRGLVLRGNKIVLVQQVRGRMLLALRQLGGGLFLRSRERFVKRPGRLRLLLPIRDAISTAAKTRSKRLGRRVHPLLIVYRCVGLWTHGAGIVK